MKSYILLEGICMKLIQPASKLLLILALGIFLTFTNPVNVLAQSIDASQSKIYLAEVNPDLGNKVKGNLQKAQGKTQETLGNISGDREDQVEGKAKQAEGEIRITQGGSESEIEGKFRQAENNIRRYQARDAKASNL
jgi:uncharacterized protein YjbJ (UPF0337 family)